TLYVTIAGAAGVARFNAISGAPDPMGYLIPPAAGESYWGILVDSGNLYVSNTFTGVLRKYNATTGAFLSDTPLGGGAIDILPFQGPSYVDRQVLYAPVAVMIAVLPGVGPAVARAIERIRHPSRRRAAIAAVAIGAAATIYLILTGIHQGRDLIPKFHDENTY